MKIAIVKLSALGEIIQSAFIVQFIKQNIPQCTIDWVVEEKFAEILSDVDGIDNVKTVNLHAVKQNIFSIFKEKKKINSFGKYDVILDLQGLFKSAVVARFLGKNTIGFDRYSAKETLACFSYRKKIYVPLELNNVQKYKIFVTQALNFAISNDKLLNKKAYMSQKNTLEMIKGEHKKAIFIVGTKTQKGVYSKENFITLANEFKDKFDGQVYIPYFSDIAFNNAKFIEQNTTNVKVLPKLTLTQLKGAISKASLLIGNDTGVTYLGWANNIPTIILHSKYGEDCTYESKNCYCLKPKTKNENINHILPSKVVQYIEKIIQENRS